MCQRILVVKIEWKIASQIPSLEPRALNKPLQHLCIDSAIKGDRFT